MPPVKQILKYGGVAIVAAALLFIVLLFISPDLRGQALSWILISRHQTSHPISREKAAKYFKGGYFPTSAHDIQYAFAYCQVSPAFESFWRFEAPVQDCLDHAQKQFSEIPLEPISKVFQPGTTWVNADWFDTGKIKHGLMGSKEGSGETIWIDTDRGVFYFHDSD